MLVPAVVSLIGGVIALLWHPSKHARSMIQHFAVGMILALGLSVEMLFLELALVTDTLKGWKILAMTAFLRTEILTFAWLGTLSLPLVKNQI